MVKSMNAAIAGLKAHQTRMDVLSNNIANVNTWGYKTRTTNFHDSVYANTITGSAGRAETGYLGGINTSQLGYGSVVSSISTSYDVGSGQYTGNSLDCMINGPAFFIVGPYRENLNPEVDGVVEDNGLFLTKVGILSPDANGYIVTNTGNYVYGYGVKSVPKMEEVRDADGNIQYEDDGVTPKMKQSVDKEGNLLYESVVDTEGGMKPIRIPFKQAVDNNGTPQWQDQLDADGNPVLDANGQPYRIPVDSQTELYSIVTWTVGKDGTIVGVDEDNVPHTIGQIMVASVENPNGLEQTNGYLYTVGANAGKVTPMATTSATGTIDSNYLEMSNVDLASDIATMITTQRGYQANTKIITVTDEMLEQLVNMKR